MYKMSPTICDMPRFPQHCYGPISACGGHGCHGFFAVKWMWDVRQKKRVHRNHTLEKISAGHPSRVISF